LIFIENSNPFIAQRIAPLNHQEQAFQGGFRQSRKPKGCGNGAALTASEAAC